MALVFGAVQVEADRIQAVCEQVLNAVSAVEKLLIHNTTLGIDWDAAVTPPYIEEHASGNLSAVGSGRTYYGYGRHEIALALSSLDILRKMAPELGNLNAVAAP
jgi:hypothetical protein